MGFPRRKAQKETQEHGCSNGYDILTNIHKLLLKNSAKSMSHET